MKRDFLNVKVWSTLRVTEMLHSPRMGITYSYPRRTVKKKKKLNSQLLRRLNGVFKHIVSGADVLINIYFMTVFTVSDCGIDRFPIARMHHRFAAIHAFSPVCGGTCWLLNLASSLTYQFRSNKK